MYFYICRVSDALVRQSYGDAFVMLGYVIKTKVNEVTKRSIFSATIDCPRKGRICSIENGIDTVAFTDVPQKKSNKNKDLFSILLRLCINLFFLRPLLLRGNLDLSEL